MTSFTRLAIAAGFAVTALVSSLGLSAHATGFKHQPAQARPAQDITGTTVQSHIKGTEGMLFGL